MLELWCSMNRLCDLIWLGVVISMIVLETGAMINVLMLMLG